jgi:hypothetical protein
MRGGGWEQDRPVHRLDRLRLIALGGEVGDHAEGHGAIVCRASGQRSGPSDSLFTVGS